MMYFLVYRPPNTLVMVSPAFSATSMKFGGGLGLSVAASNAVRTAQSGSNMRPDLHREQLRKRRNFNNADIPRPEEPVHFEGNRLSSYGLGICPVKPLTNDEHCETPRVIRRPWYMYNYSIQLNFIHMKFLYPAPFSYAFHLQPLK